MAGPGFIYFLRNAAMPGLIKIGHTTGSVETRVKQLSTTGTPKNFDVLAMFYVSDSENCEKELHLSLNKFRLQKNREFFEGSAQVILNLAFPVLSKFIPSEGVIKSNAAQSESVDACDVSLMFYLLHNGYESGVGITTKALAEHHDRYAPLELEYKLSKLADRGFVERKNGPYDGLGSWKLLSKGLQFMFEGGHVAQDLLVEARGGRA